MKNVIHPRNNGEYGLIASGDLLSLVLNQVVRPDTYYTVSSLVTNTPFTGTKDSLVYYLVSYEVGKDFYISSYSFDSADRSINYYDNIIGTWSGWISSSGGGGGIGVETDPIYMADKHLLATKEDLENSRDTSVLSVNGKVGEVTINASDLGLTDIMTIKGQVASQSNLPSTAIVGDTYQTQDTEHMWTYTDSGWIDLGATDVDLSNYVTNDILAAAINTETSGRVSGDTDLQSQITTLSSGMSNYATMSALSMEASNRAASDTDLRSLIDTKLDDTPNDGKQYGRVNGIWTEIDVLEAPKDGTPYVRQDGTWVSLNDILVNYVKGSAS